MPIVEPCVYCTPVDDTYETDVNQMFALWTRLTGAEPGAIMMLTVEGLGSFRARVEEVVVVNDQPVGLVTSEGYVSWRYVVMISPVGA